MENTKISIFYSHDHDELDGYFNKFKDTKRKNYPLAKEYFKQFKFGLQRHILWEEDILFPIFEEKTGMKENGPTAVMRQEHTQIKSLLEELHKKVQRKDPESDRQEEDLWTVLKAHNYKEENILYPAIDQLASDEEKEKLFHSMNNVKEDQYKTCCQIKMN